MKKQTFKTIQALRGIAALLISCIHSISSKGEDNETLYFFMARLRRIFISIGSWGVDLFFIISGFIITLLVLKTNECSFKNAFTFLIRRFFRIYPLFWITMFVSALMVYLISYKNIEYHSLFDIKVILLLVDFYPFQAVAWTLSFEVYFYFGVFLYLIFLNKKFFIPFLLSWGGILFICLYLHYKHIFNFEYHIITNPRVLEFFIGGLLLPILIKGQRFFYDKYISIILGRIFILTSASIAYNNVPQHAYLGYWETIYLNGFGAAFLLYGFVGLEYHNKIYIPQCLKQLGDISYSIYLWHYPIIWISIFINVKLTYYQQIPLICHSIIEVILTIFISVFSYKIIESPTIGFSQKLSLKILSSNDYKK